MKGIYAIYKRDTNECVYVGQSKNIEERISRHFNRRPLSDTDWHNNIYKKEDEYYYKVLEECDADIRGEREKYYIAELKPIYNTYKGGEAVWDEYPESAKEKLRQYSGTNYRGDRKGRMTGKIWLTDGYNNIVISETEDIQQYIDKGYRLGQTKRNSLKGRKPPKDVGEKISKKLKGKTRSKEQKLNISESRKETLKNCVLMYKGKHHAFIKKCNVEKYLLEGYTFEKQYYKSKKANNVSKNPQAI